MMVFVYSFKNIKVNNKIAAEVCAFFVVYLLLLVGGTRIRKLYRIFPAAVLLVLVCELFALNYPSLWHRESPTRSQLATEYYNDGTKDAAAYLKAQDEKIVTATTEYGTHIHASVESGNLFACQFHPEKSSHVGLQILKNFAKLEGKGGR